MNTRRNENPLKILTNHDVEFYKCHNFGYLERYCQLRLEDQEKEEYEICGIALYGQKEENKWYIDCGGD